MTQTPRYSQYCKHVAQDGRICDLYLDHYGDHADKHFKSRWKDDE